MKHLFAGFAAAVLLVGASSSALAISAISTDAVTLRAGPGTNFPEVTTVPANDPVEVFGCIEAYQWCDVVYGDLRGWISGANLAYLEGGNRVVFVEAAPRISVPIVSFSIGTYWDTYYRERPFYVERERFGGPAVEVNIDASETTVREGDNASDAAPAAATTAPASDAGTTAAPAAGATESEGGTTGGEVPAQPAK